MENLDGNVYKKVQITHPLKFDVKFEDGAQLKQNTEMDVEAYKREKINLKKCKN